jgi:hypothetical protein
MLEVHSQDFYGLRQLSTPTVILYFTPYVLLVEQVIVHRHF